MLVVFVLFRLLSFWRGRTARREGAGRRARRVGAPAFVVFSVAFSRMAAISPGRAPTSGRVFVRSFYRGRA